ncbi:MAG: transglutaminase family protein [Verrucomicrobiales bacterium]
MAIHAALYHRTTYSYDQETTIHPHLVRLRPAPHCRTPILAYSLKVEPADHFTNWQQDPFGNYLARIVFPEKASELSIVVDLVADMTVINPFDFFLEEAAEKVPFDYAPGLEGDLAPYLKRTDFASGLDALAAELKPAEGMPTIDFLVSVNQKIERLFDYRVRLEVGVQTCEETLTKASGSCRDSAFLLVQLFRCMGFAARFVSGYLIQLRPDEKPLEGPEGPSADFTDLHAWAEVFLPGAGWVGLDPTSGLFAGEGHIPLACTPEPSSAAPVQGSVDPCRTDFSFENVVRRIHEDPRVTKPYSEPEWMAIDALGEEVDRRLAAGDVRLTMGGEPTFVSIDDMDGDEWNTTADGSAKRERAIDLTGRLRECFAPGGLIWFGEGKWYPGEPVPRWAYGVFWRKDGYPMWRSAAAQGDPAKPGPFGFDEPKILADGIADILKIPRECVMPALEDVEYYRWKAATLPHFEKVEDADEDDSLERKTIAELEKRGLDVPSGYVLPLFHDKDAKRWTGAKWKFKRGSLFLVPGASAMGFRLPLDSVRSAGEEDILRPLSPVEAEFPPLGPDPLASYQDSAEADEPPEEDEAWVPRTALTIENREGRLHVFFPPTERIEGYLELLAAVELAASRNNLAVVVEGYEAPADPRIEHLKVTPDPGVIEVNIHPSASWSELAERTSVLYEEARLSRLGTEKFMLDGKHSGTGGGNHVVIGGKTPADSPFLRRPHLLASLLAYWQNHPGLSYLFSGLFIGPTSQAPRVDESRDDRLFELDIALAALRRGVDEPIMVDRIMRHLLTDLTGNTHRAEFCIDKMYSPDSPTGQLGLLELRAFEMPPHLRMALVQSLLVRSLIALFWDEPYQAPLVRWGTGLHDKFMLPHHVWEDISDVCRDMQLGGFQFESEWLRPFFEFRFPSFGAVVHGGVELELRTALEPWHVLGEESSSQGTARYVDSSLERLQLRVRGLVEGRHIVTCNDRRVPLYATGTNEEWVGAVRFKAWDPPSALHPMIKAQSPLVFNVVDVRNRKSLGGCIYHVSHPGGRSYETFPVNAREAESRRVARFWQDGHTPGVIETAAVPRAQIVQFQSFAATGEVVVIPQQSISAEFPNTLDLRSP